MEVLAEAYELGKRLFETLFEMRFVDFERDRTVGSSLVHRSRENSGHIFWELLVMIHHTRCAHHLPFTILKLQ